MSNPSVFELSKTKIQGQDVVMEDNIGEAIHLHIGPLRVDMKVQEFFETEKVLREALDSILEVPEFTISDYDPYFIEKIAEYLFTLESVSCETRKLKDLKVRYEEELPLEQSPYVLCLGIEEIEENIDIFESNEKLFDKIKLRYQEANSLLGEKIVIDENNVILDGEKRLASLYLHQGEELEISVEVFRFRENQPKIYKKRREQKW